MFLSTLQDPKEKKDSTSHCRALVPGERQIDVFIGAVSRPGPFIQRSSGAGQLVDVL